MFASPLGEKLAFYSMTGREALGRLFVYEVDLLSDDESLDLTELLGHSASVILERTDGSIREFNGYVTHFSHVGEHGRFARYRAVLRPWLWFLGQNQNSRIFQACKVPEVVREILAEHGFTDVESPLSAPDYRSWEYLVQYRESDLNFVSRILEREGIHYFFKHEAGKHTLVLADSNELHETSPGYAEVPYFPPAERERREEEHLDRWTTSRTLRPGTFSARDFQFKKPEVVESKRTAPLKTARSEYELYEYPGEFADADQADVQTRVRLEEHQADHEVMEGGGPVRGLMAGSRFKLTQFPREDQNREYLIVGAQYEISVSEFESNIVEDSEPNFRFRLSAIDAKQPYRTPRLTKKPVVDGPQTAVVTGPEGSEIHTDEYGRVKVKFHWDRTPARDENSSCWIRVSQLWAGQNWGGIHLPRIGQEVIVDFLEGDPDRPIITGRVYNQAQMPPYSLPDNATQSGIKSHSSADGSANNFNEIRFEDKKGSEELHLQAEKDMTTLVKHDQSTSVQRDRSASITGSDSISVGGDRSVSVQGNLSVSVKGGGKGAVHSKQNVTGKYALDASDTIEMKAANHILLTVGGSSIRITTSAITIIAETGASLVIDANVLAKSDGGSEMLLDPKVKVKANGGGQLLLDSAATMNSNDGSKVKLDANAAVSSNGNVTFEGALVQATGLLEASLKVGGQSVKCTPASVDVAGATVNVNGSMMVSIAAALCKIN